MNIKIPLLICLLLVAMGVAKAQNPILDSYIQEGLKSNLQLRQEQINYEKSVENLEIARALFLPQLSANASYSAAHGGRKIAFPVGDLLNPIYKTLNQANGTHFPTDLQNVNTQFLPNDFHDTKLRLIQPLFNPEIYFNYKAQKELISVQEAQRRAYENELKFNITSSYYQYLESEEVLTILKQTKVIIQELLKINQRLVANDKATKDVVLNTEYELDKIEQQLAEADRNNEVAKSYFNFLLNRELSTSIDRDTALTSKLQNNYNLNELSETALNQRQELKQVQGGMQVSNQLLSLSKTSAVLPKISVVGDAGYQGYYYKFNNDQRYWLVQFNLTWDLYKGGEKRARIKQARMDYQLAETKIEQFKKQIELQVIQSYHELEAAQRSFITSQSGVKSTEKSFQIIRSKYNEGQAIMLEFLDAENKLTTARLTQTINTYELLRKEAALQKTIANL
ncbi:MAG TPA: TolC family protein [Cyclobacteriaceae bacterium]|jgi:outer membrane protein TolC|nr:TolC family protein [Cyclobacteriaceae bacterium]